MALNTPRLPGALFNNIGEMSLPEIGYVVSNTLLSPAIPSALIKEIMEQELSSIAPYKWSLPPLGPVMCVSTQVVRTLERRLTDVLPPSPTSPSAPWLQHNAPLPDDIPVAVCAIFIFATYGILRHGTLGTDRTPMAIAVRKDISAVPQAVNVARQLGLPVHLGVIPNNPPAIDVQKITRQPHAQVVELCLNS